MPSLKVYVPYAHILLYPEIECDRISFGSSFSVTFFVSIGRYKKNPRKDDQSLFLIAIEIKRFLVGESASLI